MCRHTDTQDTHITRYIGLLLLTKLSYRARKHCSMHPGTPMAGPGGVLEERCERYGSTSTSVLFLGPL